MYVLIKIVSFKILFCNDRIAKYALLRKNKYYLFFMYNSLLQYRNIKYKVFYQSQIVTECSHFLQQIKLSLS